MTDFIEGENRFQATLFPEQLDDYIAEDNSVRVSVLNRCTSRRYRPSRHVFLNKRLFTQKMLIVELKYLERSRVLSDKQY